MMNAPDLHPEELLDAAAAGALSADEQARLDGHLAACPACRFELQARADFAALPLPSMAVDQLVTRALAGMPSASVPSTPRRRRISPAFAAAAVVLIGAGSFAAVGLARPLAVLLGLVAPKAITDPVPAPPTRVQRSSAPQPVAPPNVEEGVAAPRLEEPAAVVAAPAVEEPAAVVVTPPRARPTEPLRLSPPPAPPVPELTAAELFRVATEARAQGRRMDAEQTYRELAARFPASPEANVAHAVMGRLLLDLSRPAEALVELDAALASPDTSLREDALANRALAFDALGDLPSARTAWARLLTEFPNSIHGKRARERLEALPAP